jgi:hypothetical protein
LSVAFHACLDVFCVLKALFKPESDGHTLQQQVLISVLLLLKLVSRMCAHCSEVDILSALQTGSAIQVDVCPDSKYFI